MNFRNLNWETLKFGAMTPNPNQPGFSSCKPVNPVIIQLPNLFFPFGVSEPNPEKKITKYSLPISLGVVATASPIERELLAKFEQGDEWLPKYAASHSDEFFNGKKKSIEVCKELYNPIVKVDQNPEKALKYGPRLSPEVKHSSETGDFYSIECRDTDNTLIKPTDIKRGSRGYASIELTSLYSVAGKAFGATWVVRSVRITQHAATQAPPIDLNMYGDCPAELEADMHAVLDDYEKNAQGKREPEESKEAPTPAKKAKSKK